MFGSLKKILGIDQKPQLRSATHQTPSQFQQGSHINQPSNFGTSLDNMSDTPAGYVGNANPQYLTDGNGYTTPRQGPLRVQQSRSLQPYGDMYEDELSPQTAVQPVRYSSGQTSINGQLQQGGLPGRSIQAPQNAGDIDYQRILRRRIGF